MIFHNQQLTKMQQADLDGLIKVCQTNEGGIPVIYHDLLLKKRECDTNVFYYHQGQLLGFLSAYYFYQTACELSILVNPIYRRKGIAKHLLAALLPLLKTMEMETLIFSSVPIINDHWLPTYGFDKQQSDYHMERCSHEPVLISNPKLILRKASEVEMALLCSLDNACFGTPKVNMIQRFTYLFNNSDYRILLALKDNKVIGKAHVHWQADKANFSDIAIHPDYQGQGFGHELLSHCINQVLMSGRVRITLDVESCNQPALALYIGQGFKIMITHDYWSISHDKLAKLLSN
jgi:ribosomal protein S18 acetylase RimI-like enzyme